MIPSAVRKPDAITFRIRRRFAASQAKVFRAWTDPEALKKWWCPPGWTPAEIEVDLRAGGAYRIGMRKAGNGRAVYVRGTFLEVRAPQALAYTWEWENAFEGMPQTRVSVQFLESGGTTEVVVTHENLPELGVCLRHRSAWIAACERIEKLLQSVSQ